MSDYNEVTNNTNKIYEFLLKWRSTGFWTITAIHADQKTIHTNTFYPDRKEALEKWIRKHEPEYNIYFDLNTPLKHLTVKSSREDIKSVDYFHVDLDPEIGKDINEEQDRILGLLTRNRPAGIPEPTCIIFSGGGYQAAWKLKQPITINGDVAIAEDIKLYNVQIEKIFGADTCHNINRTLRLPYTMNHPDEKKKKRGRVQELATVIQFTDTGYDLSEFTKAVPTQSNHAGFLSNKTEILREEIRDLDILDQWEVPDRIKTIIIQGDDPENPKKTDNSRSAWLFDCVCGLIRKNVPDGAILGIITDPDWAISKSVLDQKSNNEAYAIRQIERAKSFVISPQLLQLNERFAVIGNLSGKCRIIEEVYDVGLNRTRLTKSSFNDFVNRFCNKKIKTGEDKKGNPIFKTLGAWWLGHELRTQYDTIIFSPTDKVIEGAYNLWRGFGCEQRAGDCNSFLSHIHDNIAAGNDEIYRYIIRWMARAVQKPDSIGEVAIVLRGKSGVGKSFFAKEFGKLFGRHFIQISNSAHLVGNFNQHLKDTLLLFADEAFFAKDKKHVSVLKTLITENMIAIEAKGVDVDMSPNYVKLIMASNDDHVIPAGADERRFLMLEVSPDKQKNQEYFKGLKNDLNNGGREALLHHLLQYDISDFEVREVPQTASLQNQKMLSLESHEQWWFDTLKAGRLSNHDEKWETMVACDTMTRSYLYYAKQYNIYHRSPSTVLGIFFKKIIPNITTVHRNISISGKEADGIPFSKNQRCRCYILPPLEECRFAWNDVYGSIEWDEIDDVDNAEIIDNDIPF